jgi:hypothetical protein
MPKEVITILLQHLKMSPSAPHHDSPFSDIMTFPCYTPLYNALGCEEQLYPRRPERPLGAGKRETWSGTESAKGEVSWEHISRLHPVEDG